MSRYTARAEWDPTGWWVVTIPEVPGAITQARRLDQVPKDAGEVLKLMGKGRPNQYELRVEAHYPGEHGVTALDVCRSGVPYSDRVV